MYIIGVEIRLFRLKEKSLFLFFPEMIGKSLNYLLFHIFLMFFDEIRNHFAG